MIKQKVKINLHLCEDCAKYIPDKFLRNFRVENNLEPFYWYEFENDDYEREMVTFTMSDIIPKSMYIVCKAENTEKCFIRFKELNKHISFGEEFELGYNNDQFIHNKYALTIKIKNYARN